MARLIGPRNKKSRRVGINLGLKTNAKSVERRLQTPPGQHGRKGKRKVSDYGTQLLEKQKVKMIYGLLERQFHKYYAIAAKNPQATGEAMLSELERRLDNTVYRLGFAPTRAAARQLVAHGNVTVNGKKLSIPSYEVKVGETVSLSTRAQAIPYIKTLLEARDVPIPKWLERKAVVGKVTKLPARDDVSEDINEQLIVEFYSR